MTGITAPSLPGFALVPTIAAYALLVIFLALRSRSTSGAFVIVAVAIRLAMSAAPSISFSPSGLGLSWNALASCLVIGLGGLVIRRSPMLSWGLPPIFALCFVIAISGLTNDRLTESIEAILKYGYFAVLMITVHDACKAEGFGSFLGKMAIVLMLPLVLQVESIGLGVAKAGEGDGSVSYIGGYNHEASFSLLLMAALLVVAINQKLSIKAQLFVAALCVAGVLLANYRTAIGAMLPMLAALVVVNAMRYVVGTQRIYALAIATMALVGTGPLMIAVFAERFDTLVILLQNPGLPLNDPGTFTYEDRQVMSGRAFIWAEYIEIWRGAPALQKFIGFGADAWEEQFALYAHNTLVSTLFEYGLLGAFLMLVLWVWMIAIAWRCGPPISWVLLASHFGFILLNMATMPFWMIEGLVFYGILCGAGLYVLDSRKRALPAPTRQLTPNDTWQAGSTLSNDPASH